MSYTPTEWEPTDVVTATRMNALEIAVGDMNMSYTPNVWSDGDILSAEKMNALEQAVASGGGSSDFSTAIVTATYTLPEGVTSLEGLSFSDSYINVLNADYNVIIQIAYGEEYLPLSDLGSVENINVPIYKDYPAAISSLSYNIPEVGFFGVDLANSSVVSGDAAIDMANYCLFVSGDCSLNIALGFLD